MGNAMDARSAREALIVEALRGVDTVLAAADAAVAAERAVGVEDRIAVRAAPAAGPDAAQHEFAEGQAGLREFAVLALGLGGFTRRRRRSGSGP